MRNNNHDLSKGARMGGLTVSESKRHDNTWDGIMALALIALAIALIASFLPDTPQTYRVESEARVGEAFN